jgi:hypothetical protein
LLQSDHRGVAQSGSASALGAEGRGFESLRPDHSKAHLFQAIESIAGSASAFYRYTGVVDFVAVSLSRRIFASCWRTRFLQHQKFFGSRDQKKTLRCALRSAKKRFDL